MKIRNLLIRTTYLSGITFSLLSCSSPFGKVSLIDLFSESSSLAWTQPIIDLGQINSGSSVQKSLILKNNGKTLLDGCGSVQLSDSLNFGLVSTTCNKTEMLPGEECEVVIQMTPQQEGDLISQISRECSSGVRSFKPVTEIKTKFIDTMPVKIVGAVFGDLATALAYLNQYKVGTPVTEAEYDAATDTLKFNTEENSDFSKAAGFLSSNTANREKGVLIDPKGRITKLSGAFAGSSNKTMSLGEITNFGAGLFSMSTGNNIKLKKYEFDGRGLYYTYGSTYEFDTVVSNAVQPKFVFTGTINLIINNDFILNVGMHGDRFTEFSCMDPQRNWGGSNSYDFKGNFTMDNARMLAPAVATKLWNSTFHFRKKFNITNGHNIKAFINAGLIWDGIYGQNNIYFHESIGDTEGMDFPSGTFGASSGIIYHAPASKQTSNGGNIEGDLKDIIDRGGNVLFDL